MKTATITLNKRVDVINHLSPKLTEQFDIKYSELSSLVAKLDTITLYCQVGSRRHLKKFTDFDIVETTGQGSDPWDMYVYKLKRAR